MIPSREDTLAHFLIEWRPEGVYLVLRWHVWRRDHRVKETIPWGEVGPFASEDDSLCIVARQVFSAAHGLTRTEVRRIGIQIPLEGLTGTEGETATVASPAPQ